MNLEFRGEKHDRDINSEIQQWQIVTEIMSSEKIDQG